MAASRVRRIKPPKKVAVSYQNLNVSYGKCKELGYYEAALSNIKLQEGQKWDEEANTLLHELLHAIWWCYNLGVNDDKEEKVVGTLANGLSDMFQRNPELVKYFTKVWASQAQHPTKPEKPTS